MSILMFGLVAAAALGGVALAASRSPGPERARADLLRVALIVVVLLAFVLAVPALVVSGINVASGGDAFCDLDASCRTSRWAPVGLALAVAGLGGLASVVVAGAGRSMSTGAMAVVGLVGMVAVAGGSVLGLSVDTLFPRP